MKERTTQKALPSLVVAVSIMSCGLSHAGIDSGNKAEAEPNTPHQVGRASFYADKFQGRRTANGETYDAEELTMAHRTLPMGTHVLVTNLSNNKSVVVRVNDRGPFAPKRIADLSRAAAEKLNMLSSGVVEAALRIVPAPVKSKFTSKDADKSKPGQRAVPSAATAVASSASSGLLPTAAAAIGAAVSAVVNIAPASGSLPPLPLGLLNPDKDKTDKLDKVVVDSHARADAAAEARTHAVPVHSAASAAQDGAAPSTASAANTAN